MCDFGVGVCGVCWNSGAPSAPEAGSVLVLELDEVLAQVSQLPAVLDILDGIPIAALPQLLQLLKEENGEFSCFSSVLKEPSPIDLQTALCRGWARPGSLQSTAELATRDEVLRDDHGLGGGGLRQPRDQ